MSMTPVLKSLYPRDILSFGPETEPIELGPLNVLIGPNGSGKTNFVELIGLLKQLRNYRELTAEIARGGGFREWIWKGHGEPGWKDRGQPDRRPTIEARLDARPNVDYPVRYALALDNLPLGPPLVAHERVIAERGDDHGEGPKTLFDSEVFRQDVLNAPDDDLGGMALYKPNEPILSQATQFPGSHVVGYVAETLDSFRLYRDWPFGRRNPAREPQPSDLRADSLQENYQNLAHIINQTKRIPRLKQSLIERLARFYEGFQDVEVTVQFGSMMLYLQEHAFPESAIPATRVSDGTLRWLALLAILLNPTPPPLVCIEEPEVGLHPDMMHVLAELLREASERMQLVITTHSEILVDAFTTTPEVVVVCEKEEGATTMRRLEPEKLAAWLKDYTLGNLWSSGSIGGNRW